MNIGIVGTGSIAHTMAKEFARPTTMPVVAVCSRNADTGIAMAHEFHIPIPKVYTEYDEMLADSEVELVYIATPNSLHFEQAKAALLAGKHVLCEKPIVPTVAQLDELQPCGRAPFAPAGGYYDHRPSELWSGKAVCKGDW